MKCGVLSQLISFVEVQTNLESGGGGGGHNQNGDFSLKNILNTGLRVDTYELISSRLDMMIDSTEFYRLIAV